MSGKGCEEVAFRFSQFLLTCTVVFQLGVMIGEAHKSIKDDVRISPSIAALSSYEDVQRKIAGKDIAIISTDTLALWARDCALNDIENRLRGHGIHYHRDNGKVICSIIDLIPADVAEITTAEIK